MDTSNTSFNTAISNSDESITGIIDKTLDEYKSKLDIREYMNYPEIRKLLINSPIEMSLLEVTCILINNHIDEKKR
jgi:hypothetical protein